MNELGNSVGSRGSGFALSKIHQIRNRPEELKSILDGDAETVPYTKSELLHGNVHCNKKCQKSKKQYVLYHTVPRRKFLCKIHIEFGLVGGIPMEGSNSTTCILERGKVLKIIHRYSIRNPFQAGLL
jgi:hypothetical protein